MQSSNPDGSCATGADPMSRNTPSFAELFRNLRKQLVGKQACLSGAGLRCTDAAISLWECGHRLPRRKTMKNAVDVLTKLGAMPSDIDRLVSAWNAEYRERNVSRNRPSLGLPELVYPA
jgi:hypothetical protein